MHHKNRVRSLKGRSLQNKKNDFIILPATLFIHLDYFWCELSGFGDISFRVCRYLPSPEYNGTKWRSACGGRKVEKDLVVNTILFLHHSAVGVQLRRGEVDSVFMLLMFGSHTQSILMDRVSHMSNF